VHVGSRRITFHYLPTSIHKIGLEDVLLHGQQAVILSKFERGRGETYRNEQIRHLSLVLLPRLTILGTAALYVAHSTVCDHADEEDGVEPRKGAVEARDQAPRDSKDDIAGVMNLASVAIPPVDKKLVARVGVDCFGVLEVRPWEGREGFALQQRAALLGAKCILLPIALVPDHIGTKIHHKEGTQSKLIPGIFRRVVVGEIESAVAVR
jgi:hypothetical protein